MSAPKQVPWTLAPTPDDITDAAIRTVAAHATDAADAVELLDALGLTDALGARRPARPAANPVEKKVSVEDRKTIVERYDAGDKVKDIAADYGIAPSAVIYHASRGTVLRRDKPIEHGTRRGFQQHKARGGVPCGECRTANAAYMREYGRSRRQVSA